MILLHPYFPPYSLLVFLGPGGGGRYPLCIFKLVLVYLSPEKWKVDKENGASL